MRQADTYRSERRNSWSVYRALYRDLGGAIETWAAYNQPPREHRNVYGSENQGYVGAETGRSKYMPHQGERECLRRARKGPEFDPLWGSFQPIEADAA